MMIKKILLASLVLTTYSCAGTSATDGGEPVMPAPTKQCMASQPKDAHMWINAMPGPGASERPPLQVTFTVTTPTPGYQFALKVNRVMESFPEQVVLDLVVTRPSGMVAQVVTESKVNIQLANFPGSEGSAVQVNCEAKPFFKVKEVMAVH